MEQHNTKLAHLSSQVASFHRTKTPFRIHHGSTNSTRSARWKSQETLDTSKLDQILTIDTSKRTCLVEPNVAFDTLVTATLAQNLIPPVVPEFPGITIGGAFAGTAGESSSWKYGFVDANVNWTEIILATGEIVTASSSSSSSSTTTGTDQRSDLFHGAAGSLGTMGVITLLEVQLVRAKPWVELTYHPVNGIEAAQREMRLVTKNPDTDVEFLDGILFSPTRGVVMTGKMVDIPSDDVSKQQQTFTRAADPWFYMHAESHSHSPAGTTTELIPIRDYLFRYDRGCFWTSTLAFAYFGIPSTPFLRWLLDYFMHTRIMFHAWHRSGIGATNFIIQDLAVPGENAAELIRWLQHALPNDSNGNGAAWPLWLCPLKVGKCGLNARSLGFTGNNNKRKPTAMLNVGVWAKIPQGMDFVAVNRRLEAKLLSLEGVKWLYSQTFYTAREFWAVYDREAYDGLRRKYGATGPDNDKDIFPNVYDKVKTDVEAERAKLKGIWAVWPLAGIYGVLSAIKGGRYLLG